MATPRTRVSRRPVHGVLLLDKPLGLSSNQALQKLKWLFRAEKAGHTGTLDPLATGLLPLCFGAATKFSQLQLEARKCYLAHLRLGITTTTGDAEGDVLQQRELGFDRAKLSSTLRSFVGSIEQVPPMYSALKKDGRPLYEYARAGIDVQRLARAVEIFSLDEVPGDAPRATDTLTLEVSCSKGTYIRSLAVDIGEALGCGAHLSALRRTGSGQFDIGQSHSLESMQAMSEEERLSCLLPVQALLQGVPAIDLGSDDAGRFLSGLRRRGDWPDEPLVSVFGTESRSLLGSARIHGGELIPIRLLNPIEVGQVQSTTGTSL